jgi:hypothetical protein
MPYGNVNHEVQDSPNPLSMVYRGFVRSEDSGCDWRRFEWIHIYGVGVGVYRHVVPGREDIRIYAFSEPINRSGINAPRLRIRTPR